MKRTIVDAMATWRDSAGRKPLLLRGARQVGKTYAVRRLGSTFEHLLEVNFEEEPGVRELFKSSLTPARLCNSLAVYFGTPIVPGRTLLFLDEIQACPAALASLRFFREKYPALHVVAAGSLLELVLEEIPSFAVGRVESLFMYPLSYDEFLGALGEASLGEALRVADARHPLEAPLHSRLLEHLRTYLAIGGMPEVVASFLEQRDPLRCGKVLDDLLNSLSDDFAKYRRRVPASRLSEVLLAAARGVGSKFKYAAVHSSGAPRSVKAAVDLLVEAGLLHRVTHTAARGLPLGAGTDSKKFKLVPLDVGLQRRILGGDAKLLLTANERDLVDRGGVAEAFAGTEFLAAAAPGLRPHLHYWHREARASNAEVDYVLPLGASVVPVEVKAGSDGRLRSLHLFLEERGTATGVQLSLANFGCTDRVVSVPLYAAGELVRRPESVLGI